MKIISPANIALVKHWGMSSSGHPLSQSVSFNLSQCYTTVTIDRCSGVTDEIVLEKHDKTLVSITNGSTGRDFVLWQHVQFLKKYLDISGSLVIYSKNSFPMKVGIASSASGFSAITAALVAWARRHDIWNDKTQLARLIQKAGSISACRSVMDQMCFLSPSDSGVCITQKSLPNRLDVVDLVVVLDTKTKKIGSGEGQCLSRSSRFFDNRVWQANRDATILSLALAASHWSTIRRIVMQQSEWLHRTVEASHPPIKYIQPIAHEFLARLQKNIDPMYYGVTFDAGTNPHIITQNQYSKTIEAFLEACPAVQQVLVNVPAAGTRVVSV